MKALPEVERRPGARAHLEERIQEHLAALAGRLGGRHLPAGALRRLSTLGTLQAKIAAAYLFHWVRGWFQSAEARERERAARGVFDYGDGQEFRRGIEIHRELMRRRYTRGHPSSGLIARWEFLCRGLLYRLGARIDVARIAEAEIGAAGWNREDYRL